MKFLYKSHGIIIKIVFLIILCCIFISKAENTYAGVAFMDSNGDLFFTTNDKIKTSSIWYKTHGIDVSECFDPYDPSIGNRLSGDKHFVALGFYDEGTAWTRETTKSGTREINKFKCDKATLVSQMNAAHSGWGDNLEKAIAGEKEDGPMELKFDSVMYIYHGKTINKGPFANDPTVYQPSTDNSYAPKNGSTTLEARANPHEIAIAEPWANPNGLVTHYNNWWIIGSGKKIVAQDPPEEPEKDILVLRQNDETPIMYHTNNKEYKDNIFKIYEAIPSGEEFRNQYEASSWRGICTVFQRLVGSDSKTGGSEKLNGIDYKELSKTYYATWWDGTYVDLHEDSSDPSKVTGTQKRKCTYSITVKYNAKECLGAKDERPMAFYVSYDYFRKLKTYNLETSTVFNDAFPAREIIYPSNVTVNYNFTGLNTNKPFELQKTIGYGQGLESYRKDGDEIYADNMNHIIWCSDVSAFTGKSNDLWGYPKRASLGTIKTIIANQWLEDKEGLIQHIKKNTKTKNDELIVKDGDQTEIFMKGNVYVGAREVLAGERSAYDGKLSGDNDKMWYPSDTEFESAHSKYGYGEKSGNMSFSNGGTAFQTKSKGESMDEIPTDTDNGRYYTAMEVDYSNVLVEGTDSNYPDHDPNPMHADNGTNSDAVNKGIDSIHVDEVFNPDNKDASIFVHTPVVSPFSIRNGENNNIAFYPDEGPNGTHPRAKDLIEKPDGSLEEVNLELSSDSGVKGTQLQGEAANPDADVAQLRLDENYSLDFTTIIEPHLNAADYGKGYGSSLVHLKKADNPAAYGTLDGETAYELIDTNNNVVDYIIVDDDEVSHSKFLQKEYFSKFDKYVENKWMRFPFDVEYGGVYFKANTWILVQPPSKTKKKEGGSSTDEKKSLQTKHTDFLVPAEAKPEDYSISPARIQPESNNHWRVCPFYVPSYAEEIIGSSNSKEIEVLVEATNIDGLYGGEHNEGARGDNTEGEGRSKAEIRGDIHKDGWLTKEELRAKFPDSDWPDGWEDDANTEHEEGSDYDEGAHYVAYSSMECQLSGHIYDFTVVGTSDADTFQYVDTGTHVTNDVVPFCRYKLDKKVGKCNRFGPKKAGGQYIRFRADGSTNKNTSVNPGTNPWPYVNTLPLTRHKSNCWENGGMLMKGTLLSYSLRTMANLYNDDDSIVITPSYRYLKNSWDGVSDKPIVYRTDPDEDLIDPDSGNYKPQDYHKIKLYYDDPDRSGRFIEYFPLYDDERGDHYEDANNSGNYNYKISLDNKQFDESWYDENDIDKPAGSERYFRWGNWLKNSADEEGVSVDKYTRRSSYGYSLARIELPSELRLISGEWEELARNTRQGLSAADFYKKSRYTQGKYSWAWFLTKKQKKNNNSEKSLIAGRYSQDEIDDLTHDSMQTWYGQYYIPANLYVIVLDDLPDLLDEEPYIKDCWTAFKMDDGKWKVTDFDLSKYIQKRKEYINNLPMYDGRRPGITGDEPMFITDKGYLILNFDIKSYMDGEPHLQYFGLGTESVWAKEKGKDPGPDKDPEPDKNPEPGKDPDPPDDDDEFGGEDGDVAIIDMSRSLLNNYQSAIFNIN